MTPIKSIEEELADCRAAFAAHPKAPFAWCIHHEKELEPITEPIENRIKFILEKKDVKEQAIRFRNLRPARNLPVELVEAVEARDKAGKAYGQAGEAYRKAEEAYAKAWEAYEKAWEACDKAGEAYCETLEAHEKAWDAYGEVWEACKAQLSGLHTRDWPDHTWSGRSIFKL